MPKPIYIIVTRFFPSPESWRGAYCLDFVKALMREGTFDVRVFVPGGGPDYDLDGVRVTRFPVRTLPCGAFPMLFARANERSLLKTLKREKIDLADVAVFHDHLLPFYGRAIKAANPNCRVLLHHHCLNSFAMGLLFGRFGILPLYSDFLYLWQRRMLRFVDANVFCSHRAEETYLQFYEGIKTNRHVDVRRRLLFGRLLPRVPDKPAIVLVNGVDTRIFFPVAGGRERPPLPGERFVIGCIANYGREKDQITLIRAVERLHDPTIRVRLVGSGNCLAACRRYVAEHGLADQFSFESEMRHERLPAFYQAIDLFVLPSYWEGFGCVFTEAFACGVPYLCCTGQGISELTPPEWMFAPGDDAALARKIAWARRERPQQTLLGEWRIDPLVAAFVEQVEKKKDLLVVIESVNFNGGAHVATWAMIDALVARGWRIDVMTASEPTDEMRRRLAACTIHVMDAPFPRRGVRFLVQGVCRRLHLGWVPNWTIDPTGAARRLAANYKTVLVIGENSHLRNLVGAVKGPRKVVFIHTDYATWRTMRGCDRDDARCDRWTYRAFDVIGVVGKPNAARFAACFPAFAPKVRAFHNILPQAAETAAARGGAPDGARSPANAVFKIASISRLEWGPPKKTELSIEVAARLKARGLAFDWTVYGGGPEPTVARLKAFVREKGVEDCFHMPGHTTEPMRAMREADVTTLFSAYEGVSNAIYESLLCGTPVLATDVGAASEQIRDGETGRVLPVDAAAIADALVDVIAHRETVAAWRRSLAGYAYDNEQVVREHEEILA